MSLGGTISVARDLGGIRIAVLELLEENLNQQQAERTMRRAAEAVNRERMIESLASKRTLAEGYYSWAGYLVELEQVMALGFRIDLAALRATEVEGLKVVARARAEFEAAHRRCPQCGRLNKKFVSGCSGCGAKFEQAPERKR